MTALAPGSLLESPEKRELSNVEIKRLIKSQNKQKRRIEKNRSMITERMSARDPTFISQ